jgi:hypothetical protein
MGSGVGIATGPSSGDNRDPRQGAVSVYSLEGRRGPPEAHLDLDPVPAGRYGVTEVLAGAA